MALEGLRGEINTSMTCLADELSSRLVMCADDGIVGSVWNRPVKDFLFLVGNTKVFLKRPAYEVGGGHGW